jgi:16S rRNA processing protein RimM
MEKSELYFLGKITKLHGYKGELTAWLDTTNQLDYSGLKHLFLFQKDRITPFVIEEVGKKTNNTLKLKLEGLNDENSAKPWVKAEIYIHPDQISESDLMRDDVRSWIGFHVHTPDHHPLGVLADIQESPVNPQLEIDVNGTIIFVPMQPQFIETIDAEKREIHLNLPPGLLELYLES